MQGERLAQLRRGSAREPLPPKTYVPNQANVSCYIQTNGDVRLMGGLTEFMALALSHMRD